ncbi:LOW QUALITY PROTEIN: calmodulin-binding transcription activator 2-like, partial [Apteryx mantelli]|uniref:LOW QUALITY PROTEIN: calmodulin-binding transcription activator 2-like n=1 Tax=Apteryx mantelli TaxID=2696672 RepID=A0ABM4G1P2_9AVES
MSSKDTAELSERNHLKVFLPRKLVECLPKCPVLPKERLRWNTNEEIASYLITFEKHDEWLSCAPKTRPHNGSIILYNRKKVKYRKDGYCWKKRKDGKTTREDHMKLKVQGVECLYGCYVHSSIVPTFHRRCYWLLQNPDIVLVHYLNVPAMEECGKACGPVLCSGAADRKEWLKWSKEELVSQLRPMFHGIKWSCGNGSGAGGFSLEQVVQHVLESHQARPAPRTHACLCSDGLGAPGHKCSSTKHRIISPKMEPGAREAEARRRRRRQTGAAQSALVARHHAALAGAGAAHRRPRRRHLRLGAARAGHGQPGGLRRRAGTAAGTGTAGKSRWPRAGPDLRLRGRRLRRRLTRRRPPPPYPLYSAPSGPLPAAGGRRAGPGQRQGGDAHGDGGGGSRGAAEPAAPRGQPDLPEELYSLIQAAGGAGAAELPFGLSFDSLISELLTDEGGYERPGAPSPAAGAAPRTPGGPPLLPAPAPSRSPGEAAGDAGDADALVSITDFSPEWSYPEGGVKVLITGPWSAGAGAYSCLFDRVSVPAALIQPGVLRCYCPRELGSGERRIG